MDQRLLNVARSGNVAALEALLREDPLILEKAALVSAADNPLHIAALAGKVEFAREMVRRMPSFAREMNRDGLSPMHVAAARGNVEVVKELFTADGRDLGLVKDKNGMTPLHYAAAKGEVGVIKELVSQCPQAIDKVNGRGETALHLAVKNNQFDAFRALVERLGNRDEIINAKDDDGKTVSDLAAARKQRQELEYLNKMVKGRNINAADAKAIDMAREAHAQHKDKGDQGFDFFSAVLVVATLIAGVTYQVWFNPPPPIWNPDTPTFNYKCFFQRSSLLGSTNGCPAVSFIFFSSFNTAGFYSAVLVIGTAIFYQKNRRLAQFLLLLPLGCMMVTYLTLLITISKDGLTFILTGIVTIFLGFVGCCYGVVLLAIKYYEPLFLRRVWPTLKQVMKAGHHDQNPQSRN